MTLRSQALLTANALRNMTNEMDSQSRDVPERYIQAIRAHASDLEKAARAESGSRGVPALDKETAKT